jgi:hypothetical protein
MPSVYFKMNPIQRNPPCNNNVYPMYSSLLHKCIYEIDSKRSGIGINLKLICHQGFLSWFGKVRKIRLSIRSVCSPDSEFQTLDTMAVVSFLRLDLSVLSPFGDFDCIVVIQLCCW